MAFAAKGQLYKGKKKKGKVFNSIYHKILEESRGAISESTVSKILVKG